MSQWSPFTLSNLLHRNTRCCLYVVFGKASPLDLPSHFNIEYKPPGVNLDTTDVIGAQTFVVVFKDYLCDLLKKPVAKRLAILKPGGHFKLSLLHINGGC